MEHLCVGERATYLYFDEAGNFDFSPRGTAVFVMTCVVTKRPFTAHSALLEAKYDVLESGVDLEYFHATEDRQVVRNRIFNVVAAPGTQLTAYAVIVRKSRSLPATRAPHLIYQHTFEHLVRRACPESVGVGDHVVAITDHIPVQKNRRAFEKALKPYLKRHLPAGTTYDLFHHQSKADFNLQIADYLCWAIYRKWNSGDARSYELVRHLVRAEDDVAAGERRPY